MTCYSTIMKELFARYEAIHEGNRPPMDSYIATMLDNREKTLNAISSIDKDIRDMENEHRKQRDILENRKREIQRRCPHLRVVIYSDMNETTRVCEDCGAEL